MARRALLEFEKPLVELEEQIEQIRQLARDSEVDVSQQLLQLETLASRRRKEIFDGLSAAQKIQVARHPQRPSTLDYIQVITDELPRAARRPPRLRRPGPGGRCGPDGRAAA